MSHESEKYCKSEKWVPTYIANVDDGAESPLTGTETKIEFEDVVKSVGDLYKNEKIRTNKFTQGVYNIVSRITVGGQIKLNIIFRVRLKVNGNTIDSDSLKVMSKRGSILLSINYPLEPEDKLWVTIEVSDQSDPLQFLQPSFLSVVRLYSSEEIPDSCY